MLADQQKSSTPVHGGKRCGLPALQYISTRLVAIQHPVINGYAAAQSIKTSQSKQI